MKQLVNLFGLTRRKKRAPRSNSLPTHRRLHSESLEKRQLLAGDLLVGHNYTIAEDVNADFKVTALDALLVINKISRNQGGLDLTGVARGDLDHLYDVSGDNRVTALDALQVINRISRPEAETELIELLVEPRTASGAAFGSAFNPATRELIVGVNEVFNLQIQYNDLRNRLGGDLGAFTLYTDVITSLPNVLEPVVNEAQILSFDSNLLNATGGTITFSLSNAPAVTEVVTFNPGTFEAAVIEAALTDLILGANPSADPDSISVIEIPGRGTNEPFEYQIRYSDFALAYTDIPNLIATTNLTGAGGTPVAVVSTTTEIRPRNPDGSVNRVAFALSVDYVSADFFNRPFYGSAAVGSFDAAQGIIGTGAIGQVAESFPAAAFGQRLPEPFDAFRIPVRVRTAITDTNGLRLTLAPPSIAGLEITLYDPNLADPVVPPDMVLVSLETNAASTADGAGELIIRTSAAVNTPPTISNIADVTVAQGVATNAIPFTVGDAETAAASLVVTGASNNTTLVPNANIVFGGSGANRTVTVTPVAGQSGTATITVTVSDGSLTATDTFVLTVNAAVNTAPTISNIADVTVTQGTATGAIAFTVGDAQTDPGSLVVTGASNNTTLVPNANIVFGGSGANRTVTVTPVAGQTGNATITVTVSDGSLTATDTFVLTVTAAANTAPTISNIADVTVTQGTATSAIAFTVGDAQTAPGSLVVTGASSNATLVPNANIVFGGSGANRTVTVTPAAGQTGTSTITVTVSDGSLTASDTFVLTVNAPANTAPTISNIADVTITQGTATGAIAFTVGDAQTAPASLTVSGTSSNTTLVPNANIVFGGSGANRTVTVTPVAGQTGTSTITVTVSDGSLTASDTFVLTVNAPSNTAPTISNIADVTINEDAATSAIAFTVGDAQTAVESLTVTGTSSNTTLVPNANIVFGGSGANRTVTVTPVANRFGSATITVTVSDGSLTASDTFVLTVNSVNDAPVGVAATRTITSGSVYTFSAADFPLTDPSDTPANTLAGVVITTLPNADQGTLRLAGAAVTAGQFVPVAQLSTLTFASAAEVLGNGLGSFTFQVRDNGGTANGGVDTDVTPRTFAFNLITFVPSSISGSIFIDFIDSEANPVRNGVRDVNATPGIVEPAMGGLPVRLTGPMTRTVITDAEGNYSFGNLMPGVYTVTFDAPDTILRGAIRAGSSAISNVTTTSFQVTIGSNGNVNASGNNFTVLGLTGAARETLDILVSDYLRNNGTSTTVGVGLAVLDASGNQQLFELGTGFVGVDFAEIALNDARDAALLTIVRGNQVSSLLLTGDEFAVSRNGRVVRILGSANSFTPVTGEAALLEEEFGDYTAAVDAFMSSRA